MLSQFLIIQYITKYIEVNFDYIYNATVKEDLKSKYNITSTLYIEYLNSNQVILEKNYPIIENKIVQKMDSNQIDIKEKINIDYQKYNSEVEQFKEQFNVPVTAYLNVNFNVESGPQSQEEINQVSTSKVTIDLNQAVYEIKIKESEDQENTILETQTKNEPIKYSLLVIGSILLIISTMYLIYQIWKFQLYQPNKTKIKVRKILKKYKDIIIQLDRKPKCNFNRIFEVKEFEELVNLEEEIRSPIIYYQDEQKYIFMIIDNNNIYRKIIK